MKTENIIFVTIIVLIFVAYCIISLKLRYKGIKENNEKHSKFLDELIIGDEVVLSSGIFGTLKEKNKEEYSIEISKGVIIKVLPSSIIGRRS
ncbi:preprotein translocase subunit YajC [Clostridium sp. AL.422]|uniref:preprotein translocase subunit YajC n=1 Tax=Clostridium TaxID=1485 RepID=UPI00293DE4B7|nr:MULTISPECIES: preprotein translocase subunit YajC [unclassified Clostridium]MDV4150448.1 preprotein translocase subunit YajC [Clostridium sp. AL.422]